MTVTITQLRHFIALAESGSFTRAADSTQRSQAAFSRSISVLEDNLGVALIERVGHQNNLTGIGRTVLEHARQLVAQADELDQVVKHHTSGEAGVVRIGLGATPSALLSQPLLHLAAHHANGMKIQLHRGAQEMQIVALRERRLDALVIDLRSLPPARSDLVASKICALPIGLLCRPEHPLTQVRALQIKDLLNYPIAGTSVGGAFAQVIVERLGPLAHPDSFFTLQSEDIAELLHTVRTSNTIFAGAIAPALSDIQNGDLHRLPFTAKGLESEITWVRRAKSAPNPVLDGILEMVTREINRYAEPA